MGSVLRLIHHGGCVLWKDGWLHGQPISRRPTYGLEITHTDRLLLQCCGLLLSQEQTAGCGLSKTPQNSVKSNFMWSVPYMEHRKERQNSSSVETQQTATWKMPYMSYPDELSVKVFWHWCVFYWSFITEQCLDVIMRDPPKRLWLDKKSWDFICYFTFTFIIVNKSKFRDCIFVHNTQNCLGTEAKYDFIYALCLCNFQQWVLQVIRKMMCK